MADDLELVAEADACPEDSGGVHRCVFGGMSCPSVRRTGERQVWRETEMVGQVPVELGLEDYGVEGVAIDASVRDILQFGSVTPIEMEGGDDALSPRFVQEAGEVLKLTRILM